jgi:hypothetical protein
MNFLQNKIGITVLIKSRAALVNAKAKIISNPQIPMAISRLLNIS